MNRAPRPMPTGFAQAAPQAALLGLLLGGCGSGPMPIPIAGLNRQLEQAGGYSEPALGDGWLAAIQQRGGRQQVVLVDLKQQLPVPLPGLNRPDALPIAVSADARGERLVVLRQLEGRAEVVLYRRSITSLQPIAMGQGAIPTGVMLRADGRQLAVQVSRDGQWQIDLIELP
jgi:hypothetical protein